MAQIDGSNGNDPLLGGSGDDTLTGGTGNDSLNGGAGTDVAVFSGNVADYRFGVDTFGVITIQDLNLTDGDDGTDTLNGIQIARFADKDVGLAPAGTGGVIKVASTGLESFSSFTVLANGDYVLIWNDMRVVEHLVKICVAIYGQRFNPSGVAQGGPFLVYGGYSVHGATSTVALTDGGFVVKWESAGDLEQWGGVISVGVFGRRFNASGVDQGGVFNVDTYEPGNEITIPTLPDGGFVETWGEGRGIYAQRHDADGRAVGGLVLTGSGGGDVLDATCAVGAVVLNGGLGNDALTGGNGKDIIEGGAGDDTLRGRGGADTMNGGLGNDIYYVDNVKDITAEESTLLTEIDTVISSVTRALGANLENLTLTGTEAINGVGNALDNTLMGNAAANTLNGGAGNDILAGGAGNDRLGSGAGDDTLDGGSGNDSLLSGEGNDSLDGGAGDDTLDGGSGKDTLVGGDGSDSYYVHNTGDVVIEANASLARGGTDTVYTYASYTLNANVEILKIMAKGAVNVVGNTLDNLIVAGAGNNVINGGAGVDTVSYVDAPSSVTVGLDTQGPQNTSGSGLDTLINIENLAGSNFDDILLGNSVVNTLNGGAGADVLSGGDGNDTYFVDNGNDLVVEENALLEVGGNDTVVTQVSHVLGDNLENLRIDEVGVVNGTGNSLANTIYAGAGNNSLNGGEGTDTASYAFAGAGVTVSLASTSIQATVGSGRDYLLNFENLQGSAFDDTLRGNATANTLDGGAGNDRLLGGAGNDLLIGGMGLDTITSGTGNDIFDFNTLAESVANANRDVITDFVRGQDTIDLATIDANSLVAGNQAFTFIDGADFTAAGQVKFAAGILYGNTDGNFATSEFHIALTGIAAMAAADFVL